MTVSLRVTEKKKVNQDRERSQHIFRFFLHIQVIHEKKKKTNKLNIILSQENYYLSGQQHSRWWPCRGKEKKIKEDIAATVPQSKPEHWREQAVSCGPSMAMQ